jgi:hypothetical protein
LLAFTLAIALRNFILLPVEPNTTINSFAMSNEARAGQTQSGGVKINLRRSAGYAIGKGPPRPISQPGDNLRSIASL